MARREVVIRHVSRVIPERQVFPGREKRTKPDYLHPQPYPVGKISREWRKRGIGVVNLKI